MHYIYQILAAILIGISVGALLGPRNNAMLVGCAAAIVLGLVALFVPSWIPLAIGIAIYLAVQFMQRDTAAGTR